MGSASAGGCQGRLAELGVDIIMSEVAVLLRPGGCCVYWAFVWWLFAVAGVVCPSLASSVAAVRIRCAGGGLGCG